MDKQNINFIALSSASNRFVEQLESLLSNDTEFCTFTEETVKSGDPEAMLPWVFSREKLDDYAEAFGGKDKVTRGLISSADVFLKAAKGTKFEVSVMWAFKFAGYNPDCVAYAREIGATHFADALTPQ